MFEIKKFLCHHRGDSSLCSAVPLGLAVIERQNIMFRLIDDDVSFIRASAVNKIFKHGFLEI